MKRQRVESSSIAEIGYVARQEILEVLFRTGGIYRYFGVPRRIYRELMAADSIGAYMNRHVRDRYEYRRVRPSSRPVRTGMSRPSSRSRR